MRSIIIIHYVRYENKCVWIIVIKIANIILFINYVSILCGKMAKDKFLGVEMHEKKLF